MSNHLHHYHVGTYSKLIVKNFEILNDLISKHTQLVKEQQQNSEPTIPNLLSDRHFDDILAGPQSPFIKQCMSAYAIIAFIKQQLAIDSESVFEETKVTTDQLQLLDKQGLKKLSVSEIDRLRGSLDTLLVELDQEWSAQYDTWLTELQSFLEQHGCTLNENDNHELHYLYPMSELADRLVDLKIEPIKLKKEQHYSYAQYLQMKAQIALQNHLHQQQKSNIEQKIKTTIKAMKPFFKAVDAKEIELISNHRQQIDTALEPAIFSKKFIVPEETKE